MRWIRAVLRTVFLIILLLICAALFYILVIMGGTTQDVPETASAASYGQLAALEQARYP